MPPERTPARNVPSSRKPDFTRELPSPIARLSSAEQSPRIRGYTGSPYQRPQKTSPVRLSPAQYPPGGILPVLEPRIVDPSTYQLLSPTPRPAFNMASSVTIATPVHESIKSSPQMNAREKCAMWLSDRNNSPPPSSHEDTGYDTPDGLSTTSYEDSEEVAMHKMQMEMLHKLKELVDVLKEEMAPIRRENEENAAMKAVIDRLIKKSPWFETLPMDDFCDMLEPLGELKLEEYLEVAAYDDDAFKEYCFRCLAKGREGEKSWAAEKARREAERARREAEQVAREQPQERAPGAPS